MPLILDCPSCAEPLAVARRHSGGSARCPKCRAEVDVPARIAFGGLARDAAADRRRGAWLLTASWVAGFLWLPVAPAVALWLVSRHIRAAREDGRPVVGQLHAARVVATTALFAQCVYFTAGFLGWPTFLPLRFLLG